MPVPNWPRVEALMHGPVASLDTAQPPVSAVGGTTTEAIPIEGLREAQAVKDAFTSVGWDINIGHEWSLNTGFPAGDIPTSLSISFSRVGGAVRTWVTAQAMVSGDGEQPVTPLELQFLTALFDYGENPFPSMAGIMTLGRTLGFQGVDEADIPRPYAQIAMDWNILVAGPGGRRYEPFDPPVRAVQCGYYWHWISDPKARTTAITQAVNNVPTILEALGSLQSEDSNAFRNYAGDNIPTTQLGRRWTELRGSGTPPHQARGTDKLTPTGNNKIGTPSAAQPPSLASVPLESVATREAKFCGNCGQARSADFKFCGNCGTSFAGVGGRTPGA